MITEMLERIPKEEARRLEEEMRKEEKLELQMMRRNMWKKWRGKNEINERKIKIPTELEKVERKLEEMSKKIDRYKERKDEQVRRRDLKKKEWKEKHQMIINDHWTMMSWLTKYIEENQLTWERRGKIRNMKQDERLKSFDKMSKEEMIMELKNDDQEGRRRIESKKEKATGRLGELQHRIGKVMMS